LGMAPRLVNEVRLHSRLSHPAVVDLLGFFEDEHCVYLVMELCHKGDLYRYLRQRRKLDEDEAAGFIFQVCVSKFDPLHVCHFLITLTASYETWGQPLEVIVDVHFPNYVLISDGLWPGLSSLPSHCSS